MCASAGEGFPRRPLRVVWAERGKWPGPSYILAAVTTRVSRIRG
jgi:hypothetical protein